MVFTDVWGSKHSVAKERELIMVVNGSGDVFVVSSDLQVKR